MCKAVPSSAPNITATKDKLSLCKESDCVHVRVCANKHAPMLACVASGSPLGVPALLRPVQTELQPKAPPRLRRTGSGLFCFTGWAAEAPVLLSPTCLALNPSSRSGHLWSSWQPVKQKILCSFIIFASVKPTHRRKAVSALIKYSVFWRISAELDDDSWSSLHSVSRGFSYFSYILNV